MATTRVVMGVRVPVSATGSAGYALGLLRVLVAVDAGRNRAMFLSGY